MGLIKITTGHFDHILWANSNTCNFEINDSVDTWKINVSSNLLFLDDFLSIMLPQEIAAANRFFHTADKNRYIVTRGAVRTILGKYLQQPPAAIRFGTEANKKPFILGLEKKVIHFNLSHSSDRILLSVADTEVGADIEFIDHKFNYQDIMDDYFSNSEAEHIKQNASVESFFTLWTRKEALIKATGKGLVDNIELLPGLPGVHTIPGDIISSVKNWLLNSFKADHQYIASLAYSPLIKKLCFFESDFNKRINIP